jgi:tetratricopeptide (TPR) repeat protein
VPAADPGYGQSRYFLGLIAHQTGRLPVAAGLIRQAMTLDPRAAAYPFSLGNVLHEQGDLPAAAAAFRQAIALDPTFPDAHNNLGNLLWAQNDGTAALACFHVALAVKQDFPEAWNNLGNVLRAQSAPEAAVEAFRHALALRPDFQPAHTNLGTALADLGLLAQAEASFRTALALRPDDPSALSHLGTVLEAQGQRQAAITLYRSALAIRPDDADTHTNLGLALLAQGDFAVGWPECEWRWRTARMAAARRGFTQPRWCGEAAAGRTLLIHAEQGVGDTLQFCRFAPLAAARGLRVILRVQAPLVRLLTGLPNVDLVLADGDALPDFDLHCPMLSLPLLLGTRLDTIPPPAPLRADPALAAAWRDRLPAGKRRIGVVWAGAPEQAADRRRSMPAACLAPLCAQTDVTVVSLQFGARPTGLPMTDFMPQMRDFADTAALIAGLDLIVSVDTAVAHLAASMGKTVWLLDRFDPCWRWLEGRRDSPWYPTLRIYRQPRPGDWDSVIADVVRDFVTTRLNLPRYAVQREERFIVTEVGAKAIFLPGNPFKFLITPTGVGCRSGPACKGMDQTLLRWEIWRGWRLFNRMGTGWQALS